MIIDPSAIVAILRGDVDSDRYEYALAQAEAVLVSAGTYLEAAIVVDANRDPILSAFRRPVHPLDATIYPVTEEQAVVARQAYRDFGKGNGHPAALNFGECFAYALARITGRPLLFRGDDFSKTDVAGG